MKNRRLKNAVISIVGMFLLLAFAYGIDTFREFTNNYYNETSKHLVEIYWSYIIDNLLLSAAAITWLWFVFIKADSGKWIGVIFICSGLIITIYPVLYFTPLGVLYVGYRLSPAFQVYLTSGIITVAGILKLITQHKKVGLD